jgi:hypothetical protein
VPVPARSNIVRRQMRGNSKRPRELRGVRGALWRGILVQRRAMRVSPGAQHLPREVRGHSPGPDELRHVRDRLHCAFHVHGKRVHRTVTARQPRRYGHSHTVWPWAQCCPAAQSALDRHLKKHISCSQAMSIGQSASPRHRTAHMPPPQFARSVQQKPVEQSTSTRQAPPGAPVQATGSKRHWE